MQTTIEYSKIVELLYKEKPLFCSLCSYQAAACHTRLWRYTIHFIHQLPVYHAEQKIENHDSNQPGQSYTKYLYQPQFAYRYPYFAMEAVLNYCVITDITPKMIT